MPGAPDTVVVDTQCQAYRQESPNLKAAFEAAARTRKLASAWRDVEAGSDSVASVALQHARCADLIVTGQTEPQWLGKTHLNMTDWLAVESGRRVLIVPRSGRLRDVGQNVLVAWNGRREGARAVFDALPILRRTKTVRLISVNPRSAGEVVGDMGATDIRAALERHGVTCEAPQIVAPRGGSGQTLLACAEDYNCDLLVMGCYGHTRLREFVPAGRAATC